MTRGVHHRAPHSRAVLSRNSWMRDTTVWLAIALCVATVMVILTQTSVRTPVARDTSVGSRNSPTISAPPSTQKAPVPRKINLNTTTSSPPTTTAARPLRVRSSLVKPAPARKVDVPASTPTRTTSAHAHSSTLTTIEQSWSGTLSYPSQVSYVTSFTSSPGQVRTTVSISPGTIELQSVVRCPGGNDANSRRESISVVVTTTGGGCSLLVHLPSSSFHSGIRASFRAVVDLVSTTNPAS